MGASCPISRLYVDERSARLTSGVVAALAILALIAHNNIIVYILCVDFLIKAVRLPASPISLVSKRVSGFLWHGTQSVNCAPKQFAARVGAVLTSIASIASIFHMDVTVSVCLGILSICALLESIFSYCIGCKMYSLLTALRR